MANSKQQLNHHCLQLLNERIAELQTAVKSVQEARNNETKSSAGDKYETGRAMMQQEEDKLLARLDNTRQMRLQLSQIDPKKSTDQVDIGSLVETSARSYYLSVSLGKVILEGQTYFCVSMEAPLAQALRGKERGNHIVFNQRKEEILSVD